MTALAAIVPGRRAPAHMLINVAQVISAYFKKATARVEFGTSGHRGSSLKGSFNEGHIIAITKAIIEYRDKEGITGPLYIGFDTHALSKPAFETALRVLAAYEIETIVASKDEYTPTPVISRNILRFNQESTTDLADGIVITPSHNGPQDGGFKYNPPHGGPADTDATGWIQNRANELLAVDNAGVDLVSIEDARNAKTTLSEDFITPFVEDLEAVIDFDIIQKRWIRIGVDPLGGSGVHFWEPIARRWGINLKVVNPEVDPTFGFMTVDSDSTIRMDCSSPDAMAGLISLKDRFDIAFGNDPDADRHGIVTPDSGLMNPNHYLAVAIWYIIKYRPELAPYLKFGKTLVSSTMIDRVVAGEGRELYEVPVGFKWFVEGLSKGDLAFGGEESAGASLLDRHGKVWTTDKDGFAMALLSAEILARTGKTPSQIYREMLVPAYGDPYYARKDGPITDEQKAVLKELDPNQFKDATVAGLKVVKVLTKAPGNNASMGGVKVILADGSWFAIRPSGTEPKMKLYVESFGGRELWDRIAADAPKLIFG